MLIFDAQGLEGRYKVPVKLIAKARSAPKPTARTTPKKAAVSIRSRDQQPEVEIGLKLKHARLVKGLRLRELAEILDCSESFLSKVENNRVRPSLSMLHKLVGALGTNIALLFSAPIETADPVQVVRSDDRPVIRTGPFGRGPGILLERLIAASRASLLEANIHCVEPGGHTDGVYTHEGEEIGYILEGEFQLQVEGKWYDLKTGDSFFLRSNLPHGYRNKGSILAKILWVNTPATF